MFVIVIIVDSNLNREKTDAQGRGTTIL